MKRCKVVLYNPKAVFYTMPLGLLTVGSALDPERYEVVIVDGRFHDEPMHALRPHLEGALCLGIGVLTGAPIRDAIRVSRAAKALNPRLPVVWGGWHPSIFGLECLEEASVDVTVQAQGEETFAELLERLELGKSLEGCLGCCFRDEAGHAVRNPPRPLRQLDELRAMDYSLLPVESYFERKGKRQLDYISSQGCHFRCGFCADPFVYGRKWTGSDSTRVGAEVDELWQRHRFDDLSFQDETYFTRAKRVAEIAEEFLRRGERFTWAATMRADQGERLGEEVFALCRRSGLRRVIIGVESGDQATVDRIQKDISLEQVLASADKCKRHGVAAIFPFIIGFPDEPDSSIQASLDFARRLRTMSPSFQTPIFQFKPYPGLPLTDEAIRRGFRLPSTLEEWADFDFVGSAGPWVSPRWQAVVERFRFYQELGYGAASPLAWPLRWIARRRCELGFYGLPLEQWVSERIWPPQRLS